MTAPATVSAPRTPRSRFRGDVEGLRAIAVLLVLAYHAGVPRLGGGFLGVDIFLVVSGFVITQQLVREVEATGRVSLLGFYGRRAKRLLPAASLVLVVTAVAAWLLTSRVQWQQIGGDIVGAALYVVNWVFAARSVDYLAEDVEPSPVLHYWSLAVEEQFYLLWPVLLIGLVAFLRWRHRRSGAPGQAVFSRRSLMIGLAALVVVPSLACSVLLTLVRPAEAFFVTPTRLWELGVGALVALGAARWSRWRQRTGALVAWAGLAAVLASPFLVDSTTPWPGAIALLPVLGTAAVIVGGFSCPRRGAAGLLGLAPMVWVGGLSYSLYLWHWPLLRFWEWEFGAPTVTQGVLIVAASFLPAWLSYRFVEGPIRHASALNASPRFALSVGINASLVGLVAGLVLSHGATLGGTADGAGRATGASWSTPATQVGDDAAAPTDEDGPPSRDDEAATAGDDAATAGDDAAATSEAGSDLPQPLPPPGPEQPGDVPFFEEVTPTPVAATDDLPELYDEHLDCYAEVSDEDVTMCERGDPDGDLVVAVVGDSKVGQWLPALEAIAADRGWLLQVYTKNGCAFTPAMTVLAEGEEFVTCQEWSTEIFGRITGADRPDVLVTSALRSKAVDESGAVTREGLVAGYVDYWEQLGDLGVPVVALSDSPQPGDVPGYECAADHPDDPGACTWTSDDGHGSAALRAAAEQVDTAHYIDMNPWICPEGTCSAVYRNVLTYRQGSHITATFSEVLTEPLAGYLVPLVEEEVRR